MTGEMVEQLILNGADIVKVGIGPGRCSVIRTGKENVLSSLLNESLSKFYHNPVVDYDTSVRTVMVYCVQCESIFILPSVVPVVTMDISYYIN